MALASNADFKAKRVTADLQERPNDEIDNLYRLVNELLLRVQNLTAPAPVKQIIPPLPTGIHVREKDGVPDYNVLDGVEFDQSAGHAVSLTSDNLASVTRTPSVVSPANVGVSGAGASVGASNDDHTHEGVHSVKSFGGAAILGDVVIKSGGGCTITQAGQTVTITVP